MRKIALIFVFQLQIVVLPSTRRQEEISLSEVKVGNLISISIQQDMVMTGDEEGLLITTITISEDITAAMDEVLPVFP